MEARKSLALNEMISSLFGIKTTFNINPLISNAMIAVNQMLSGNPRRVGFTMFNLSTNTIYISPQNDVSASKGIRLAASGGSVSLVWDRDFELCSMPWYCMASADTSAIYLIEIIAL